MVDQKRIAERLNELADGLEADCPLLELGRYADEGTAAQGMHREALAERG